MIEAGLIAKFHSKWWPKLSECGDDSTQTATELHIDGMAGIFIVYAAFTGLATLFFVTEIILYRIIHRKKEIKIKSAETVDWIKHTIFESLVVDKKKTFSEINVSGTP